MSRLKNIQTKEKDLVNAVVEISMGSKVKTELDSTGQNLVAVRELKYKYPFNYGYLPRTLSEDADALDAVILGFEPIQGLTVVSCRVIGTLKTVDTGAQDDKVFLVPSYYALSKSQEEKLIKEAIHFLKIYKYPNCECTVIGDFVGKEETMSLISEAMKKFERSDSGAKTSINLV